MTRASNAGTFFGGRIVNKTGSSSTTRVRVTERTNLGTAFREARLSREEELVLRMRHGISEPRTATLEFRGQTHPELAAKLALMEISALDELHAMGVTPRESPRDAAVKASIIDRLRRI